MSSGWASELLGTLLGDRVDHGRFVRGLELLDDGRVLGLQATLGRASASIVGSQRSPYEVTVRFPTDGRPTHPDDLRFDCTCPDWGDPCKHGVALAMAVAEALDEEPELAGDLWGEEQAHASTPRPERPLTAEMPSRPLPTDRPAWAEALAAPEPPRTVEQWLGGLGRGRPVPPLDDGDALLLVEALGPLLVGGGWDIAPALRLLLLALRDA